MNTDPAREAHGRHPDEALGLLLTTAHDRLVTAVRDRLSAGGGVPELRDPDLTLGRALAAVHRALGTSVSLRLTGEADRDADDASAEHPGSLRAHGHPLADRVASVRIRYRGRALRTARSYDPGELMPALAGARRITGDVIELIGSDAADTRIPSSIRELERLLEEAEGLTEHDSAPADSTPEYLRAVERSLAVHAQLLQRAVRDAHQLLKEELVPVFAEPVGHLGSEMVTRDLADDLEQAWVKAHDLSRAVAVVEAVSNDFTGEDLRQVDLSGVSLAGVLWNASTVWPEAWESFVIRASAPEGTEPGVLVVTADPCDTAASADA
ncbi:hypothetical protein ACIRQY_23675 [Streptomyces sp. NPDC101490]|uniref:hypothetical protein n=1 Tax=Streptomyces sp. NPDC101490 TaxID=3366143 RepID=UPI0038153192